MSSVNLAMLIGNLGSDPEIRYTATNEAVANLRVATNEAWKDAQGAKQERTEWHRVVAFGKLAEQCKEYLTKGRQVWVMGRIQTREWQDKEGNRRFTTEIIAREIRFLGGGSGGENRGGEEPPPQGGAQKGQGGAQPWGGGAQPSGQPAAGSGGFSGPSQGIGDDDIPF